MLSDSVLLSVYVSLIPRCCAAQLLGLLPFENVIYIK